MTPPFTRGVFRPARPGVLARRAGSRRAARHALPDRGAVTAEVALALPAVVLVLAVVLVTVAAGGAQLRCTDAARAGARAAAIGEPVEEVRAVARRVAGEGAVVVVRADAGWVEVEVSTSVPGAWFTGGRLAVTGTATARAEP